MRLFKRLCLRRRRRRPSLSIIVPFTAEAEERERAWRWLERFWRCHVPDAEIIVGVDHQCDPEKGIPYSKATAVNEAARRARGRVFAIIDADVLFDPLVLEACVDAILEAADEGRRLWFIPYMRHYRLTMRATNRLLRLDPCGEFLLTEVPPVEELEEPGREGYGHRYGAMALVMSREAFFCVGGMDPRFRGWGSEDGAFMRALDTLWAMHEVTDNEIFHLWHPRSGDDVSARQWKGQVTANVNAPLSWRYGAATGDVTLMRALVNEGRK